MKVGDLMYCTFGETGTCVLMKKQLIAQVYKGYWKVLWNANGRTTLMHEQHLEVISESR
jgi:hypothetical protein